MPTQSDILNRTLPAVTFTGVSHLYKLRKKADVQALDDVSFKADAGKVTAIVGPNGSGKTTVFKLMNGLLPLQTGVVQVNGYAVGNRKSIQNEVGVVFQSPSLDDQLSARENIVHYGHLYGLRLGEDLESNPIVKQLGIADVLDSKVSTLSGGFQRRVELAKVLITMPKTIILDEPFSGLDAEARENFFSTLRTLAREQGLTVLLITHILHIASRCDAVIVLDRGKVIADDDPSALMLTLGGAVIEIHSFEMDKVLKQVEQISGLRSQRISDTDCILTGTELATVLAKLNGTSGYIEQIESRKPTLEDYFQSVTGHQYKLMEEAEEAG